MKANLSKIIQVLHLEDRARDAETVAHLLRKHFKCNILCVKNEKEYKTAISESQFDVILSNFNLPLFSGSEALQLARKISPVTPFLFVSEPIGEAAAVECIKMGAADFVLKDAIDRIVPAIRRALEDASQRSSESRNGIAHELNNVLLPIVMAAEMLQTDSSAEERSDWVDIIASSARRGQEIIEQLTNVNKSVGA